MLSKYFFDPYKNEMLEYHEGKISFRDATKLLKKQFESDNIKPGVRSMVDLRNAQISINTSETDLIIKILARNLHLAKEGKRAIITTKGNYSKIIRFFKKSYYKLPVEIQVFTSTKAANNWLNR